MPTAIIYLRLSREDEDRRRSDPKYDPFELHRATLERLASEGGFNAEIVQEIGSGATLAARPGFCEVLRRVEAGEIKTIIAAHEDRLTRADTLEGAFIIQTLADAGVTVITPGGVVDLTDDSHRLLFDVKRALAHYELQSYRRRLRANADARARKGLPLRAFRKLGYRYDKMAETYSPDPASYPMVQFIFARIRHASVDKIVREGRGKWESFPNRKKVYDILSDPFYCGRPARRYAHHKILPSQEWVYSEVRYDYETPVSDQEWQEIRRVIRSRHHEREKVNSRFWLSGLLRCGRCGASMSGTSYKDYSCFRRLQSQSGHTYITGPRAEAAVSEYILGILSDQSLMLAVVEIAEAVINQGKRQTDIQSELAHCRSEE